MEEENLKDLKEESEVETLYETFADLASSLSEEHSALAIAAVMNAVSMSIYKTAMSEEDYDKMAELIYDLRHDVQTFSTESDTQETIH
jgi:predicted secreted protein